MTEGFRVQLERVRGTEPRVEQPKNRRQPESTGFGETLAQVQNIRFSNHAHKRLQTRDILLTDDNVHRLAEAIDKAEKRGGRSSLVLVDDLAFIVNVQDRLVVTALDDVHRGEGVFTQIDSVVFADPPEGAGQRINTKG